MISYRPFRVLVADKNIETTALAQELGISAGTMSKLNAKKDENDAVSLKTIDKLCKYFGVSIEQIVEIK